MEALALAILAAVAIAAAVFGNVQRTRPDKGNERWRHRRGKGPDKPRDAADQLRVVMRAPFQRARLMSREEYAVYRTVEAHLTSCGPGYRLMAQPSMGEFLTTSDKDAYLCVNSKRVDMLVIDAFGMPVVAIEHQGGGHFQGDASARDAVKREALRKAGVDFLEIYDHHQPDEVRRMVSDSIRRQKPPASSNAISPWQPAGA